MSIITTQSLGAQAHSAGLLDQEAGRFVRRVRFSITTGSQAMSAHVLPGAQLTTRFTNRDVNALGSSATERVTFSSKSGDLVLSLPIARKIRAVRLRSPVGGDKITAYRFDGDVVSDAPVKTATHRSTGAQLNVTDTALILRRKNGNEATLSASDIDRVDVRYSPVNPRLALRLADDTGVGLALPLETDDSGLPVFPRTASHDDAFAATMQSLLDGLPTPLPPVVDVDLLLISDQACSAQINTINLAIAFETTGFSNKTVLNFSEQFPRNQEIQLNLPHSAQLSGGVVSISVSGLQPEVARQSDRLLPLTIDGTRGIPVQQEAPIATQVMLPTATTISGVELVLAALDGAATVRSWVFEDADGTPGALLAQSEPCTVTSAAPTPVFCLFDPFPLPSGPNWIGVQLLKGTATAMIGGPGPIAVRRGPEFVLISYNEPIGLAVSLRAFATLPTAQSTTGPLLSIAQSEPISLPPAGTADIDLSPYANALASDPTLSISFSTRATISVSPPLLRYTV